MESAPLPAVCCSRATWCSAPWACFATFSCDSLGRVGQLRQSCPGALQRPQMRGARGFLVCGWFSEGSDDMVISKRSLNLEGVGARERFTSEKTAWFERPKNPIRQRNSTNFFSRLEQSTPVGPLLKISNSGNHYFGR